MISVRFYEGVLELCLTAADKKDPQRLGPHFYKNGEPEDDRAGQQAFQERYRSWIRLIFTPISFMLAVS